MLHRVNWQAATDANSGSVTRAGTRPVHPAFSFAATLPKSIPTPTIWETPR